MVENGTFYIREHHLKFRITAECFSDKTPEELAEDWIRGIDGNPRYQTLQHPQVRQAMRDGYAQHIRSFRAGQKPKIVEGVELSLDPICTMCTNAWCGDSTVYRKK
ncbi:MAG: hypothetical protein A2804_02345 [Candidatus Pacebacteria bacterium RIFCSPHIGHO2_01_FULL_46_10]|nr:MAG: hypothetical protein A2804_02345 [Candidatus Pacebacteria bacterium RIFCSPHIGHO2_01_FULL_46_10]